MSDNGENGDNGWGHTERVDVPDLIVKSAVKERLRDKDISPGFYEALNQEVYEQLQDAAARAKSNDRKTVQPRDL